MLRKIEKGDGVGYSIIDKDGKIVDFKLMVVARKSFFSDSQESLEYAFLSPDGRVNSGSYSGRNTGMGISDLDNLLSINDQKWQEEYRIFETDLNKIIKLADEDVRKQDEFRQAGIEKKEAEVKKLNLRPLKVKIGDERLDKILELRRNEAEYSPRVSHSIRGGGYSLYQKDRDQHVWLDRFVAKDGKLLVKSFCEEGKYIFGEVFHEFDPKALLTLLLNRMKEVNKG